jgi:signal transduction histidine kinase
MNLRSRVVLTMTVLLAVSCALFAAVSLVVLDRVLKSDGDAHLATIAQAIGQIVDYHHGRLSVDAGDRAQIATLHGPEQRFAVLDARGRFIYGSVVPPANARRGLRFASTTKLHDRGVGTVLVWQSDDWILRIDRELLVTFVIAGIMLVAIGAAFARVLSERILRLQESFDLERRFVADASHELRTPLAVVRAETDLALRKTRTPAEYQAAFASIDGEVGRLEAIVDDLLDTMRDRAEMRTESIDIATLIERTAERLRPAASTMHILLDDAPPIRGNAESIERAATAVLHNAITHGGGGSIDVRLVREAHAVRIDVADDGPGFAPSALTHATERFWRADSARSRAGTGLGLSIARVLVEAHGGELRLANAPGRGAVVSLVLPA